MRKEARYGKSKSYRKRIKGPDGKYHDVYGRTIAERDLAGMYSRRINVQHRLVYQVFEKEKTVRILAMWTHYEN